MINNDEVIAQIYQTMDYKKFKKFEGNREVELPNIAKLIKSIGEVGLLLQPILINEKFEIIDGQTRLAACKELNIPAQYMIGEGYGDKEIKLLNMYQSNWKTLDYVFNFAIKHNPHYIYLLEFMTKHNFNLGLSVALLRESIASSLPGPAIVVIKTGQLKIINKDIANEKAVLLNELLALLPVLRDRRSFQDAMLHIFTVEGYNHKRMLEVVKRRPQTILESLDGRRTCTIALQKLYNARLGEASRVRFWTEL